jgi:transcriptional regulator with XRE-family HTH domain
MTMNVRLTLGEKLKDLRTKRELRLADLSEATGISVSTLQRMEADEDIRVGYQDVETLARFHDVSADYLFGLTDLDQYRNIEIDKLRLSDEAIAVLRDGKLNNRLISELIAHADFPQLLSAMEIYIDRKVLPQMNTMNAMYRFAEQTIKGNAEVPEGDELMAFLQQSVVDEDEYLRFRISGRFNTVIKSLFDAHKKDKLPPEQADMLADMKEQVQTYLDVKKEQGAERGKLEVLGKQLGLNISQLSNEEIVVLIKALGRSEKLRRVRKRK